MQNKGPISRGDRFLRKIFPYLILFVMLAGAAGCSKHKVAESHYQKTAVAWPDSVHWWKANNLRTIQVNLPAYEAGLNPDSLVADLVGFSANTLIINAGGIMAFYP
ncbi:MAG TPA: hypothetical protein VD816_01995, partial [Ohtaekwangia sp.]|nr:hypothetical protein [Ohtaekwangia sp.]